MRTRRAQPVIRLTVGLALVLVVLALGAAPVSAHAELLSSEPAGGQVLDAPPGQVALHFNEGVDAPGDAIEVFDSSGDQLDVGDVTQAGGGRDVLVTMPEIDDGAYVVTWRVSSADSHPIRGGFTFRVGEAGDEAEAQALMERLVAGEGGDSTVGVVYGAVRFLAFAGMVVLVGGAAFVVVLWPPGGADQRVRRLLGAGWVVVSAATILGFGLQATYAAGETLSGAVDLDLIGEVFDTRAGRVWIVRLVILAVVVAAVRWLMPRRAITATAVTGPPSGAGTSDEVDSGPTAPSAEGWRALPARWRADRARITSVGALGLALLATVTLAGHAGSGDLVPLALVVDVVHLAAVSFWLGGLALLLVAVLRRSPADPGDAAAAANGGEPPAGADRAGDARLQAVVGAFSTLALWAVATIVVTGTIQGARQTQGFAALFDTTYGRVLMVKVLVFTALVAVAALSRNWVHRRWRTPVTSSAVAAPVPGVGPGAKAVAAPPDAPADDRDDRRPRLAALRRSVGVEAGIAAVVLGITALLVNTVPAVDDHQPTFSAQLHGEALLVAVEIDPAAAGTSDITIQTLSHAGEPLPVEEVTASLSLPSRDIGPIPLQLQPDDGTTGRYLAADTDIPLSGIWELVVAARISQFEENEVSTSVTIR